MSKSRTFKTSSITVSRDHRLSSARGSWTSTSEQRRGRSLFWSPPVARRPVMTTIGRTSTRSVVRPVRGVSASGGAAPPSGERKRRSSPAPQEQPRSRTGRGVLGPDARRPGEDARSLWRHRSCSGRAGLGRNPGRGVRQRSPQHTRSRVRPHPLATRYRPPTGRSARCWSLGAAARFFLKDRTAPDLPVNLSGQIYKSVDFDDEKAVREQVHLWVADDLSTGRCPTCPPGPSSPLRDWTSVPL
jgi:hypothetical protein